MLSMPEGLVAIPGAQLEMYMTRDFFRADLRISWDFMYRFQNAVHVYKSVNDRSILFGPNGSVMINTEASGNPFE